MTATYADQSTAQQAADSYANTHGQHWETRNEDTNPASPTGYTRYSNVSFPTVGLSPRVINDYDDHSFEGANTVGLELTALPYEARNKTLLTGTKVYQDDGSSPLLTIHYYDDRARLIQSVAQNHLGGTDRISNTKPKQYL